MLKNRTSFWQRKIPCELSKHPYTDSYSMNVSLYILGGEMETLFDNVHMITWCNLPNMYTDTKVIYM